MAVPALFTRMSRPPNAATVFSTAALNCRGVCRVRLNGECLSAGLFDCAHDRSGGIGALGVGDGHLGSIGGQALCDGGADAARSSGDKGDFVF